MTPAEMMTEAHAVLREPFIGRRKDLVGMLIEIGDAMDEADVTLQARGYWPGGVYISVWKHACLRARIYRRHAR